MSSDGVPLPEWRDALVSYCLKVLAQTGRDNWELSVLLCGDETIRNLNAKYRNIDEATDVLSFILGAEETAKDGSLRYFPGDIVISLETIRENAEYFQINADEELRRVLIHGILHLDGMDHESNDANEPMIVRQETILNTLKEEYILQNIDELCGGDK